LQVSSHQLVGFVFARRDLEGVDELGLVRLLTAGGVGSGDMSSSARPRCASSSAPRGSSRRTCLPAATSAAKAA